MTLTMERPTRAPDDQRPTRGLVPVFVLAAFLGSTLLFLVQPMAARLLLPIVGGSASLWNTAMVFFQLVLLAGYVFAHGSTRLVRRRWHPFVQTGALLAPFLVLPIAVPAGWSLPADVQPSLWVLSALAVMVGLPFFALATASPTLQVWFAATDHPRAHDPYFLYAAGNVGSVGALLAYPLLIEPLFSLRAQARIWAVGYSAFVIAMLGAAAWGARRPAADVGSTPSPSASRLPSITPGRRATWLFLSFVPSLLMLGVTLHISTDIASFPLLWIVPLVLYLVTFIIAFASDSERRTRVLASVVWFSALPVAALSFVGGGWAGLVLVVHLAWFFCAALLCHSKLAAARPHTHRLTEYYLFLSIGGALGGVFASLVAPTVFAVVLEYPIGVGLALAVARSPEPFGVPRWLRAAAVSAAALISIAVLAAPTQILVWAIAAAAVGFVLRGAPGTILVLCAALMAGPALLHGGEDVLRDRSFFGVYTVVERDGVRELVSGTTVHGSQLIAQAESPFATTYYHVAGPVGQVMEVVPRDAVGVVGLGAGSLADYARPGDEYAFFEIDQLVVDIATNPELFTYLQTAEAPIEIIVDDGRHGLSEWAGSFDVLIIDAFSSDAIPVHLLTAEAMDLYLDRLDPDGTLMIHISNRHFDLRPVVARLAAESGAAAYVQEFAPSPAAAATGASQSVWMAIAGSGARPGWLENDRFRLVEPSGPLWTDDYSNVLGALDL